MAHSIVRVMIDCNNKGSGLENKKINFGYNNELVCFNFLQGVAVFSLECVLVWPLCVTLVFVCY